MEFLAPGAAWWMLSLPLLVCYYLFRPEPRRRPSTTHFLWKMSAPESQGGRFAKRLRSNPLLWLQLLILALLAIYLMRPASYWTSSTPTASRVVIMIDRSASMSTNESFQTAKQDAHRAIDNLLGFSALHSKSEVMLIAVDSETQILVPFTRERSELHRALDDLQITDSPDNLEQLGAFFHSLVRDQNATVWLFGDHLPERLRFPGVHFSSAATSNGLRNNVGIMTFSVENDFESGKGKSFAYARLENYSESAQQRLVQLELLNPDDPEKVEATIAESTVLLQALNGQTLNFPIPARRFSVDKPTLFRLRLQPIPGTENSDVFSTDDEALAVAAEYSNRRLTVGISNDLKATFLLRALLAANEVDLRTLKELALSPDPQPLDLLIKSSKERIPSKIVTRSQIVLPTNEPDESTLVETLKAEPKAELVSNSGIEWSRLRVPLTESQKPASDETVLLSTNSGPALTLSGKKDGKPSLNWKFPLAYSSLPLSPALPVIVGRFVDSYSRGSELPIPGSVSTSNRTPRPLGAAWQGVLKIEPWSGQAIHSDRQLRVETGETTLPALKRTGLYKIHNSSDHWSPMAVNLFSLSESRLPVDQSDLEFPLVTDAAPQEKDDNSGLQYNEVALPWLLAGLLLLFLEAFLFLWRGRP